jgi:hypothetical protein
MPYFRHSRNRIATSNRARFLDIAMQICPVAGFTLNRRANQFCFTSICRMPLLDLESRQLDGGSFFRTLF